jgi:hypothetical protein
LFVPCLSDSLRRELAVRARLTVECSVQDSDEELGFPPAPIEAEDELVQVTLQVFRADAWNAQGAITDERWIGVCPYQAGDNKFVARPNEAETAWESATWRA